MFSRLSVRHWQPIMRGVNVVCRQLAWLFCAVAVFPAGSAPALTISDYYSPWNAKRARRQQTHYIVLHTTEGPKQGALEKLWRQGEANYLVDEAGRVYRIVHRDRVAEHAGLSMWNGLKDLDTCSVGVEVVGYHNRDITTAQYAALRELVHGLQRLYGVPDERVLTHCMVAYGLPNQWFTRPHRGRKRCGMLFASQTVRRRLGLMSEPALDPDVQAGRLINGDPRLAATIYARPPAREVAPRVAVARPAATPPVPAPPSAPATAPARPTPGSGVVIGANQSAWDVAKSDYNSASTVYVFPNGRRVNGNQIVNWKAIPPGTRVFFGGCGSEEPEGAREIGVDGADARAVAGAEYDKETTVYFIPDGSVRRGSEMSVAELQRLPAGTKVLPGYAFAGAVSTRRSVFEICGMRWNQSSTLYKLPQGSLVWGDQIREGMIPGGTMVFYRN
jgi:N-acetylmuramoyl-L-alanine amidase